MKPITELHYWTLLEKYAQQPPFPQTSLHNKHLHAHQISLDISHQLVDDNSLDLLIKLAEERHLNDKIHALIQGENVNVSEKKPALHTALRHNHQQPLLINGFDITQTIMNVRESMWSVSKQIREGVWRGFSGKPIKNIVNIGIGGSDLGSRFCIHALKDFCSTDLTYHFVSDIAPDSFENTVKHLDPASTLFIIASKSFTTQETLYNARKAFDFIGNHPNFSRHFIAVTVNEEYAKAFGIKTILPIWEWIGGRYSLCSAINLITCIAIGYERFSEILSGANTMDKHFAQSHFQENLPVMMALIGIWNINFLNISNLLLLVYARQLEKFVPYIQQLDMESNGKSTDITGQKISCNTGPIVWGGQGNQAQHSYYQLLCQGTHKIAADFISTKTFEDDAINKICNTKIRILSQGLRETSPEQQITGGMPINHIKLASLSPYCLGELIALYEHKVFTQGALWGINSFDQPGVESAKQFGQRLMAEVT